MTRMEMQRVQVWERYAIIRPHLEDGMCQTEIASVHHISLRTVQRWIHAYRQEGLTGLGMKGLTNMGHDSGGNFIHARKIPEAWKDMSHPGVMAESNACSQGAFRAGASEPF